MSRATKILAGFDEGSIKTWYVTVERGNGRSMPRTVWGDNIKAATYADATEKARIEYSKDEPKAKSRKWWDDEIEAGRLGTFADTV